jgi:hypothetical protein
VKSILAIALFISAAWAQSGGVTGTIAGDVVDSSKLPMAGVRITLQHAESGAKRVLTTDSAGQFRLSALPIGTYTLRAEMEGFAPVEIESFTLSLGQTITERVQMKVAIVAEKIEVQERPAALDTTASTASVALGSERVEETPSQGRGYLNVVLTAPGVAASSGSSAQRSAAGTRQPLGDSGFSFAGMRGRNNSLNIDGVDNRDETTGGNRVAIGMEMVQEFRVSNTLVSAENGGAAGGIVNVTTWSGTNLWHGDGTFFTQNEFSNARNPEAESTYTPRFRRYQPGHSLNGPIYKDRTFFAYAVEQEWESEDEWSDAPASLVGKVAGLSRGLFPTHSSGTEASFKLTHLVGRHSLSARYAFSRGRNANEVLDTDNFADRSARGTSLTRDHSFVGGWIFAVNPTLVSDLRVQVARRDVELTPNSTSPMIEIPGVITFGEGYRLNGARQEDHFQIVEGLTVSRGKHQINFGGSVQRVGLDSTQANREGGIFVFPTLTSYLNRLPDVYLQAFGDPHTKYSTLPLGFWINDHWQVRPGLTFDAGIRYDRQAMPSGLPSSSNNVAPRLGVAWRPTTNAPFVLRAGFGLFYDRYPLAYLNDALQRVSTSYVTGALAAMFYPPTCLFVDPATGQKICGLLGPSSSHYQVSSHFPSTYSRKATAGMEYSLDRDTTITGEFSYIRGFHLPRTRNINGGLPPTWQLEQTANSSYQGGSLSIHRRLHKEVAYLISYTLGSTHDDASDFDEQPQDPRNLQAEWARSRQHQLQRVAASAVFDFPAEEMKSLPPWMRDALEDISISPIFTSGSGRPINALESSDILRTGAYPISARAAGLGRNPFYSPPVRSFDLRIMKTFSVIGKKRAIMQVGVEGFNLTNHNNPLRVSQTYAAQGARLSSYGQAVETLNARQIQFFAQFEF